MEVVFTLKEKVVIPEGVISGARLEKWAENCSRESSRMQLRAVGSPQAWGIIRYLQPVLKSRRLLPASSLLWFGHVWSMHPQGLLLEGMLWEACFLEWRWSWVAEP